MAIVQELTGELKKRNLSSEISVDHAGFFVSSELKEKMAKSDLIVVPVSPETFLKSDKLSSELKKILQKKQIIGGTKFYSLKREKYFDEIIRKLNLLKKVK